MVVTPPVSWLSVLSTSFEVSNWLICEAVNHSVVPNCSFTVKVVVKMQCLKSGAF